MILSPGSRSIGCASTFWQFATTVTSGLRRPLGADNERDAESSCFNVLLKKATAYWLVIRVISAIDASGLSGIEPISSSLTPRIRESPNSTAVSWASLMSSNTEGSQ